MIAMPDLNVVAVLTAKPGSESAIRDALASLVPPTREEEGCISYDLYSSTADATVFVTIEKWRGQEDLDAHMGSAHIAATFATAGEHMAGVAIHTLAPIEV